MDIKETEFDADFIGSKFNEFKHWIKTDLEKVRKLKELSGGDFNEINTDSEEFIKLFTEFIEQDSEYLEEDQSLSKLDLMAGELIKQIESNKKMYKGIKVDRPYIEQYMNTSFGTSTTLNDNEVGYILSRVLENFNLKEDDFNGGSSFNPGTRRPGDEEARSKMVQRDAGVIDPERRAAAVARLKKHWPRVSQKWIDSRTDEYLEQTAESHERMAKRQEERAARIKAQKSGE